MGLRILSDRHNSLANFYDSTSDWAFGPVFYEDDGHDADERAEAFLRYLGATDPRSMKDAELEKVYVDWRRQEATQWKREAAVAAEAAAAEDV